MKLSFVKCSRLVDNDETVDRLSKRLTCYGYDKEGSYEPIWNRQEGGLMCSACRRAWQAAGKNDILNKVPPLTPPSALTFCPLLMSPLCCRTAICLL